MSSQLQLCHVQSVSATETAWVPEAGDYSLYSDLAVDESLLCNMQELANITQVALQESLLQANSTPAKSLPFPGTAEAGGMALDVGLSCLDEESLYTTEGESFLEDVDVLALQLPNLSGHLWYDTSAESQGLDDASAKTSQPDTVSLGLEPYDRVSRDQAEEYQLCNGDISVTDIVDLLTGGEISADMYAAAAYALESPGSEIFADTDLQPQYETARPRQKCQTRSQLSYLPGVLPWDGPFEIRKPKPNLEVKRQPPKYFRVRYEKETSNTPKGFLRNEEREPIAVKLSGLPLTATSVTLQMSIVTQSGVSHPTIHPSCFGKTMSPDWKENPAKRTVTTTFRISETGEESLTFLAVRREKMGGMDLSRFTQNELKFFRVKIKAIIPLADSTGTMIATVHTNVVQAVCPTRMSKIRNFQKN